MSAATQNRDPKGIPTGGRFAPDLHAEPTATLESADPWADHGRAVEGAASRVGIYDGHAYEYASTALLVNPDGQPEATINLYDDEGDHVQLVHNYVTGRTRYRDSVLNGPTEDPELIRVVVDDICRDHEADPAGMFEHLRQEAVGSHGIHPDLAAALAPAPSTAQEAPSEDAGERAARGWIQATPDRPFRPYAFTVTTEHGATIEDADGRVLPVQQREPATRSEARRDLSCPRLPKGTARVVDLNAMPGRRNSERDDVYRVVGPASGAPLVIRVKSGMHQLEIESGRVCVEVTGSWGGAVRALGGEVDVIVDAGQKQRVEFSGSASGAVRIADDARVIVQAKGRKGIYVTGGAASSQVWAYPGSTVNQDGPEALRAPVKQVPARQSAPGVVESA